MQKKNCTPTIVKLHFFLFHILYHLFLQWLAITVWKFDKFSITQILREINFGNYKSAKLAILTHLKALNCDFLHLKAEIRQIDKMQSP